MRILAVETSSKRGSIALYNNGSVKEVCFSESFDHGYLLVAKIKELLCNENIEISSIDVLGVDYGPGSYTGLRIGIACVKTLAFMCREFFKKDIKIVTVGSLDVLAFGVNLWCSVAEFVELYVPSLKP